jgi:membrane protein YdbS with pleckstrin-like domain
MTTNHLTVWLNAVFSRLGGDILVVQTIRNAIMSASILASAGLVALMGVLAVASHWHRLYAFVIAVLLATCVSLSIAAIVQFSKLGFSVQFQVANHDQAAERVLIGLRLVQISATLLAFALILAAFSLIV